MSHIITKKDLKDCTMSLKYSIKKREKLKELSKTKGVSLSNLISQMIDISYKEITKKDL